MWKVRCFISQTYFKSQIMLGHQSLTVECLREVVVEKNNNKKTVSLQCISEMFSVYKQLRISFKRLTIFR